MVHRQFHVKIHRKTNNHKDRLSLRKPPQGSSPQTTNRKKLKPQKIIVAVDKKI
jgi:hypothetical protein